MASSRQQKQHHDLGKRLEQLKVLVTQIEQEIEDLRSEGELAPPSCWIVRKELKS